MIHYHGLPITPVATAARAMSGRHAFVSFRSPAQIEVAAEVCQSFAIDNGAFSAWRSGEPITDWRSYYAWVEEWRKHPGFDFAVIPDVIDGDEAANDALLAEWPHARHEAAAVWHMHESLDRLAQMAADWPRVALGSSGAFAVVGTPAWWRRTAEAMRIVCDDRGRPRCRLHGLRMLNPEVFTRLPFASADSTNIGQNVGIDGAWRGTYQPPDRDWRAMVMAARIESHNSSATWRPEMVQTDMLFGEVAA